MGQNKKENGRKILGKASVFIFIKMEKHIRENLKIILLIDMEN